MIPRCNICESNQRTVVFDPHFNIYHCLQCRHTFTFLPKSSEKEHIYVEDYFDSTHKNWFEHPNYALFGDIHKTILQFLKREDYSLLDVGSGRGDFLNHMRVLSPKSDLCGIDVAPCDSKNFKFILGDFLKADFQRTFDVITNLDCIEHIADPDAFVRKIRRLISPGGLVVTKTVNSRGMMYRLAEMLNKIGIHVGYRRLYSEHHIHHFTNQSLKLILEKHQFKIISQKNHNYSLASVDYPPANLFTKILYKSFTAIIFFLSFVCGNGVSQTVVCVPINQAETKD